LLSMLWPLVCMDGTPALLHHHSCAPTIVSENIAFHGAKGGNDKQRRGALSLSRLRLRVVEVDRLERCDQGVHQFINRAGTTI
jgi:hypothetical protein